MKFKTFKEWIKDNLELLEDPDDIKCTECDGTGILTCNLDHDHDCDSCDGSGDNEDLCGLKSVYETQLKKDKELLKQTQTLNYTY